MRQNGTKFRQDLKVEFKKSFEGKKFYNIELRCQC